MAVEVGGGLRSYETAEGAMLDGYGEHEQCSGGRGQPLIPWPNRLRDGRYEFAGQSYQTALTEPEAHNAIHGLVRWANWTAGARAQDAITLEHTLHPQTGWPGVLAIAIEYALADDGLSVTTTATNVGDTAVPYGAGQHPYLTLGSPSVDSLTLQVPARAYLETDERGIPTGVRAATGTSLDFTSPREIGPAQLDTGYTDLIRDPDGLARVRLATNDGARRATLWLDAGYGYVMVFTGDTLAPSARRRGLAVEPMTCAPNAFVSGAGLVELSPGASHTARWGITPS